MSYTQAAPDVLETRGPYYKVRWRKIVREESQVPTYAFTGLFISPTFRETPATSSLRYEFVLSTDAIPDEYRLKPLAYQSPGECCNSSEDSLSSTYSFGTAPLGGTNAFRVEQFLQNYGPHFKPHLQVDKVADHRHTSKFVQDSTQPGIHDTPNALKPGVYCPPPPYRSRTSTTSDEGPPIEASIVQPNPVYWLLPREPPTLTLPPLSAAASMAEFRKQINRASFFEMYHSSALLHGHTSPPPQKDSAETKDLTSSATAASDEHEQVPLKRSNATYGQMASKPRLGMPEFFRQHQHPLTQSQGHMANNIDEPYFSYCPTPAIPSPFSFDGVADDACDATGGGVDRESDERGEREKEKGLDMRMIRGAWRFVEDKLLALPLRRLRGL